jgi:hypothetical protein
VCAVTDIFESNEMVLVRLASLSAHCPGMHEQVERAGNLSVQRPHLDRYLVLKIACMSVCDHVSPLLSCQIVKDGVWINTSLLI